MTETEMLERIDAAYRKGWSDGFNWMCLRVPKSSAEVR